MVVYSKRCYTLYPILGWLCHPRSVLGFLLDVQQTTEYKGEWDELTTPATANKQVTTSHHQAPLAMSDTFDSTKSRDRLSLSWNRCLFLTLTNTIDYRTELNNFLQVNGGSNRLKWQTSHQGPQHELIWTAICYSKCFLAIRSFPRLTPDSQLTNSSMAVRQATPWEMRRKGLPI